MHSTRNTRIALATLTLPATLLLLTLGGCRREVELEAMGDRTETLSVQMEGGDSRAAVNTSTGAMSWMTGDQIAVLTNLTTKTCNVDVTANKVNVPLGEGEMRRGYAVYPASAAATLTASSVVVTYPASYDISDNLTSEHVPIPMVAVNSSGSTTLAFCHVGGLLRIVAILPAGTATVEVTTTGGYIVGNATVTNPGTGNATTTISSGSNTVTFTVHATGLETNEVATLNIPVPCGSYTGITVTAYDSSLAEIDTSDDGVSRFIDHRTAVILGASFTRFPSGSFSVSSTKLVCFAPGNLMAKIGSYSNRTATASEWKFGEPFETAGTGTSSGNHLFAADNPACVGKWVDLFSFQGDSSSPSCRYHGLLSLGSDTADYHGNEEGEPLYDGCWNGLPISNGGEYYWYPLTHGEWAYLISTRAVTNSLYAGARYTLATIDGTYKGMILFPDNYTHPDGTGFVAGTYNTYSNYTATVSLEGWDLMEAAGCVFLPVTGWRSDYTSFDGVGVKGLYFSATASAANGAYDLNFQPTWVSPSESSHRYRGFAVRLVRDAD